MDVSFIAQSVPRIDSDNNIIGETVPLDNSLLYTSYLYNRPQPQEETTPPPPSESSIFFNIQRPLEERAPVEPAEESIQVMQSDIDIWSIWYETGGLTKLRIDQFFMGFRLFSIYSITSIPFWMSFNKQNHDISDAVFSINLIGLWIYYTITYFIMAWFIMKNLYTKIKTINENRHIFDDNKIDIDTIDGIDIDKMAHINCNINNNTVSIREDFLVEACRHDNVLIGLEDKNFIDSPIFTNLVGTLPLEIAFRVLMEEYYFKNITWTFNHRDGNSVKFANLSKKLGVAFIPFIPAVFIFSVINHIFTYIHNGSFLSLYDYNRLGIWKFRYYNEFMFQTKKRLVKTKTSAEAITINLFLESWKSSVYKCLSYMLSAFSGTLLVFSFFGYEWIWGMDVITISATCGILSTMLFPRPRNQDGSMTQLRNILKRDLKREEVGNYFQSKFWILFKEIFSIFWIPVALYFIAPQKSFFIADFMHTYYKNGKCTLAMSKNKQHSDKTRASNVVLTTCLSSDMISLI